MSEHTLEIRNGRYHSVEVLGVFGDDRARYHLATFWYVDESWSARAEAIAYCKALVEDDGRTFTSWSHYEGTKYVSIERSEP